MNAPSEDALALHTATLCCAAPHFQRTADELVRSLRRAMGVPAPAEAELEQEFAALRKTLDAFYPEFAKLFAGLLSRHLGRVTPVVLASLESDAVQAYLRVADDIHSEVNAALRALAPRLAAAVMAPSVA